MSDLVLDAVDSAAREEVLDIRRSFIVQAPAGSGKTDLLTRRFLRLLATVDEPEEILAITFTRAATAEMRARLLGDLEAAAARRSFRPDELPRVLLAQEALAHAEKRGWRLLDHPERLTVETIDSLCLRIAQQRPLLARLGGRLEPTENAAPLYSLAARRTLQRLGSADTELDEALAHLLDLRDNRLADCEALLVHMLSVRDQWQHIFPLSGAMTEDDWERARLHLQAPFTREIRRVLGEAFRLIDAEPNLRDELLPLAHYACANGNERLSLLAGVHSLSALMPLEHWKCICDLLLTDEHEWRRTVDKRQGFPAERTGRDAKQRKDTMVFLLGRLRQMPQLLAHLAAIRGLPPSSYSAAQWITLRYLCTVLRHAIAELRVVFAEQNAVDFTEISLAAPQVLKESPERILDLGGNVRHLLVDEFQDTSRRQHELVSQLVSAWDPGDGRTCFLVGDPMQSIYMFRQAEVELFTHVREHGIGLPGEDLEQRHRCDPVQLSVNFRSHGGLTAPLNQFFHDICSEAVPTGAASVPFAPATASTSAAGESAVHVHPQIVGSGNRRLTQEETREARHEEAREVLRILEQHLPLIERALATNSEYRVAVLVRARTHLAELLPLLRDRRIPFRAVEIERLSDRQELLDLLSLTRALLHPMDRVAWLAVLRAPWCGLTLADLHRLTGSDDLASKSLTVLDLIDRNLPSLSPDGQRRLARTTEILRRALDLRWRQSEFPSFCSWIERTWRTLGGASCVDATGLENAQVFFSLLDTVAPDGLAPATAAFDTEMHRLFAEPDPGVSERCGIQLMTIHKAKGLGFDVVIVPGLDRAGAADPHPLVCSLERVSPFSPGETEFLIAPIGLKGEENDPLFQWVRRQRQIRFDEERKRLFYVACTRARTELHLLGTAVASESGIRPEKSSSLLHTAWPALHGEFEAALTRQAAPDIASRVLAFPAAPGILEEVAAAEAPPRPGLRRLRLDADTRPPTANVTVTVPFLSGQAETREFRRPQGPRQARAIGSAVHALLQRLGPSLPRLGASQLRSRAVSLLRAAALGDEPLRTATAAVTNMLLACAADPVCRWILSAHPEAQSEVAWTGWLPGESSSRLRTLRADRVFRAGPEPLAEGSDCLWVIDYKTSAAPQADRDAFLRAEREVYAPQLRAYAEALRALHGPQIALRLGLYYPTLSALDWWPDEPGQKTTEFS